MSREGRTQGRAYFYLTTYGVLRTFELLPYLTAAANDLKLVQ